MTPFSTLAGAILFAVAAGAAASTSALAAEDAIVGLGAFEGRNGHVTTGGVTVERTPDGYQLVLGEDFSLDGAPDPRVGFGAGGFVEGTDFTPLNSATGRQVYAIPDTIDPAEFSEVYIWCGDFSVALGVAEIE